MEKENYIKNRRKIIDSMKDNSLLVLFAGMAPRKSGDETYAFTPNRNFYYATGIDEQKDILLIYKINSKRFLEIVFINRFDEFKAKWVGKSLTKEEATSLSGVDTINYLDEFNEVFSRLASRSERIYLDLERQGYEEATTVPQNFASNVKEKYPAIKIKNIYENIAKLRMVKSKDEIVEIEKAISITAKGVEMLMENAKSGILESSLEAYFDFAIKQNGAKDFAFKTIAASGKNATVLHYSSNDSIIKKGDLILFDLGAEFNYYKSDITRTFPVEGKFSQRQKEIYEIVLKGQELVFSLIRPGTTLLVINEELTKYYAKELKRIGLIKYDQEVSKYYYHSVSHHLGLDTHDANVVALPLEEGNVITVEPGLYIEEESIGIRIEDDALVTKDGCRNLSSQIIKSVEEIERFMNNK